MTKVEEIRIYSDRTGAGLSDEYISRWVASYEWALKFMESYERKRGRKVY